MSQVPGTQFHDPGCQGTVSQGSRIPESWFWVSGSGPWDPGNKRYKMQKFLNILIFENALICKEVFLKKAVAEV